MRRELRSICPGGEGVSETVWEYSLKNTVLSEHYGTNVFGVLKASHPSGRDRQVAPGAFYAPNFIYGWRTPFGVTNLLKAHFYISIIT